MVNLDKRLLAAAGFARQGKKIADVGTDHAYLPIWLCENNISAGGVASDINAGPTERAKYNIKTAGLEDKIQVVQTDGLNGIDSFNPEDIFILGMGGELIASILSDADFIRDGKIRLILQPMTHAEILRQMLISNGFTISDEALLRDGKRFYQIICAEYDGEVHQYSEIEYMLGKINIEKRSTVLCEYAKYLSGVFQTKAEGMKNAGLDCARELMISKQLEELSGK